MRRPEPCRCLGCLASIPPAVGATPAEHAAHAGHLLKLVASGALPDPAFRPYPQPATEHVATPTPPW